MNIKKNIKIVFLPSAEDFIDKLNEKTRIKLFKSMRKTQMGFYGNWFKKLKDSDGIFEFRIDADNKFYRLFSFWDKKGETETLIIVTHGIAKKTNKTPPEDINKAEKLKKKYFDNWE